MADAFFQPQPQQQPQDQMQGGGHYSGGGGRGRGRGGRGGRGGFGGHHEGGPPSGICKFSSSPGGCFRADCKFQHPPGTHNPRPPQNNHQQQPGMTFQTPGQQPMMSGQMPQQQPHFQGQQSQGKRPCKYGTSCRKFMHGQCMFDHSQQTGGAAGQQMGQPMPNMMPGQPQMGQPHQAAADQGAAQFGQHAAKNQAPGACNNFQRGFCKMVKCKHVHTFSSRGISVKFKTSLQPLPKNFGQILKCFLINQGTQMVVTTTSMQCYLLSIPQLQILQTFQLQGTTTAASSSDLMPNNLFFGLQENFTLKLMTNTGEITQPNAHAGIITALEATQYSGEDVVFSAGQDKKLKAWKINRQQSQMQPIDEKDLQNGIFCLQMMPNNVIVAGLENGSMSIWNLNDNSLNSLQAHQTAITSLHRTDQFLISGDTQGNMILRDVNSAQVVLQSPMVQQGPSSRVPCPITSFACIPGQLPIVVAGDSQGQILFMTMDNNQPLVCAQGGHNDVKQPIVKVITISSDGQQAPVTIDSAGNFRLWM